MYGCLLSSLTVASRMRKSPLESECGGHYSEDCRCHVIFTYSLGRMRRESLRSGWTMGKWECEKEVVRGAGCGGGAEVR